MRVVAIVGSWFAVKCVAYASWLRFTLVGILQVYVIVLSFQ